MYSDGEREKFVNRKLFLLAQFLMVSLICLTGAPAQTSPPCISFTVVVEDTLHNVKQGFSADDLKWFRDKIAKKYPAVCYVDPSPDVPVVFYIRVTPDTYHGTRVINQTSTQSNPVDGTITDQDGNTSQVSGTEQTTTTTSTAVPYSFEYGIYTLSVERKQRDGTYLVMQTFQQRGIYNTYMGIPLGGRGHHPAHAVIEDAAKWINTGGLRDQRQGSLQSEASSPVASTNTGSTLLSRTLARAQAGDIEAQDGLGAMYGTGDRVPQDYAQAAIWFRKAAEQGDAFGEYALGTLYENGEGLPKDPTLAFQWYHKAADQGYPEAEKSIGLYYYLGDGPVPKDYIEAYFWLDLAAAGDTKTGQKVQTAKYRDLAASHLTPVELSQVQQRAIEWFTEHPASK